MPCNRNCQHWRDCDCIADTGADFDLGVSAVDCIAMVCVYLASAVVACFALGYIWGRIFA